MTTSHITDVMRRYFPDLNPADQAAPPTGQAQLTAAEQREFHRRRALRRHDALADPLFAAARLDDASTPARTVAAWVRHYLAGDLPARHSLLLLGNVGTGKTHLAYAALRELAEAGHPRADWAGGTAAEVYRRLRPESGENHTEVLASLIGASVLLLDDLGANKHSDFTEESTLTILDARYRAKAPVIATGNANLKELAAAIGDRALSRLLGMAQVVEVKGRDRRLP